MSSDLDIDETFRAFAKITGNWGTYVLTIRTKEDLKLLRNKTFLTNFDTQPTRWTLFTKQDMDCPEDLNFARWEGTQVMFIGDIAEAAGFKIEEINDG